MNQQSSLQDSVPAQGMQKLLRRLSIILLALTLAAAANAQPYAYAVKSADGLFKINLANGNKDFIGLTALPGQPPVSIEALALSPDGVLYGVGGYAFYKIDTHNGGLAVIKHLLTRPAGSGLDLFQAMAFKGTTLVGPEARLHGDLVTIDPNTVNTSQPVALVSAPTSRSNMAVVAMTMLDAAEAFITADSGTTLQLLNVGTGKSVMIRHNLPSCLALAFAGDGKLYALGVDSKLYSVNTANGDETLIADASTSSPHPWSDMVTIPLPPVIYRPGVVNAASRMAPVAPGSLATIFGYGFAPGMNSAPRAPTQGGSAALPTMLGGVSVKVNGVPAPIYYADFQQINFQVPYETLPPYPLTRRVPIRRYPPRCR